MEEHKYCELEKRPGKTYPGPSEPRPNAGQSTPWLDFPTQLSVTIHSLFALPFFFRLQDFRFIERACNALLLTVAGLITQ